MTTVPIEIADPEAGSALDRIVRTDAMAVALSEVLARAAVFVNDRETAD